MTEAHARLTWSSLRRLGHEWATSVSSARGLYTRLVADEVHLWQIGADERLIAIDRASLNLESRLQEWLARDISILDPTLLVIGREVETDFGGFLDILCVDAAGDLVIVELKRDKTPREVTAQASTTTARCARSSRRGLM